MRKKASMEDDLRPQFERAAQEVVQLSKAPDDMTKLRLYALYKQALQGDCGGKRPGFTNIVGRAKYDSWQALKGMGQEEAMQSYIELVEELKAQDQGQ